MESSVAIGDKIPAFSLKDYKGIEYNNNELIGNPFVLYFYPKDDTPGCTLQACSFRDSIEIFDELKTAVIGISPDNPESHRHFIQKHNLNFILLCDDHKELARQFGAIQKKDGEEKILRSTFVVDARGVVRWMERPVNIEKHSERVIEAVKKISK